MDIKHTQGANDMATLPPAEILTVTSLESTTITTVKVGWPASRVTMVTIISTSEGEDVAIVNNEHHNCDGFSYTPHTVDAAIQALMEAVMG